ncbi:conserved hypothetical protein [Formosa agariphila KMM 3901]|uniref:Uncharacterized protein n=1 Tax=Formosa agariphila (strain DSM 15362 / KCTC 12365 / LMG 23005 / KMM 3901 / M-2Alg 35-1) TaxID=1347342 RepID=T2KRI6_FORAG|nr:glycosyltransferase family 4 protein [Formosa agariphila]CDF80629.1 conserved hypothetical protein [Formosa agariphila KMM 3901]
MKTVLIIYPHWVPANLAGVQRPRLIGNYLKSFGWHPLLLTVESEYYEEPLDPHIAKTASKDIEVIYTKAYNVTKPRLIGDIGLRAFPFLKAKALEICKTRKIDAIWIPIPSFYTAILGRILHDKTGIPYGIDYIDPWVRDITNQNDTRAKLSQMVASNLEPYAVKKAAFITGVSTPYYWPVIERNFKKTPIHAGMPYGFDPNDHKVELDHLKMPWDDIPNCKPWIYAGAFLPNSHMFMDAFFKAIAALKSTSEWDSNVRLFFIGTGPYPAKRITAYAADYGLEDIVFEDRERHPFLNILNYISKADRVLLFGSTEKHYTASKTYQCLLSERPLFTVLHGESQAVQVIKDVKAEAYLVEYFENENKAQIADKIELVLREFQKENEWNPLLENIEQYSSKQSARVLADVMDEVLGLSN